MSVEEVQKEYNDNGQIGPAQRMTLNDYMASNLHGGLQCITCFMVVNQDATVHPGQCLNCYANTRQYVSHFDEHTHLRYGELTDLDDVIARGDALKDYGVKCLGEKWVPGYGTAALWTGPILDKDTQNLLCLRMVDKESKS